MIKYIAGYSGYLTDNRKDDDLAVRRKIMNEIGKSREYLKNILGKVRFFIIFWKAVHNPSLIG
jgi:hypothetical protein